MTLELSEELAEKLTKAFPDEAERQQWIQCSLIEQIEWEEQDRAEMIDIVNAELGAIDAGEKGYTLEEMRRHWDEVRRKSAK